MRHTTWFYRVFVLLCLIGWAPRSEAGGSVTVISAVLTSDAFYDEAGNTVKPSPDYNVWEADLGLAIGYNWSVPGLGPSGWDPVVGIDLVFWMTDVRVTEDGQELTSGFQPAFIWPIVYWDSRHLKLAIGYELDLGPTPDPARRRIPNTDLSDVWTLSGTVKYPVGAWSFTAGVDYLLTLAHEEPGGVKVDPSDWVIVRASGTYSFGITETVTGNVGILVAFYHYTAPETDGIVGDTGNHLVIQPQFGVTLQNFSVTVIWGSLDEYTSGGISLWGKNGLVKKPSGFQVVLGYSF